MEFNVNLEQFEGPLDLMLHLVHEQKLDLFELNLEILATQYVKYIREAMQIGLDVSSEYLVEFCGLMDYKSKRLLPKKEVENTEDNYQEDPAKIMAMRLREYERCKQEAKLLEDKYKQRQTHIDKAPASLIDTWSTQADLSQPLSLKTADLQRAFERVMRRYQIMQPYETKVEVKELSVEERIEQILALDIFTSEPIHFEQLLIDTHSLHEVVVTFLALLELIHADQAIAYCNEEDEIWIQRIL